MSDHRGGSPVFPLTRWSLVQRAGGVGCGVAREEWCRLYWYPLYAFARSRGWSAEDAEDATQGFFHRVLEGRLLAEADQAEGRLRSFLLRAFEYDLIDEQRKRGRQKRGGGVTVVPLDQELAERLWQEDQQAGEAALVYEKAWVETVFRRALESVRMRYAERGQESLYLALRPWLDTGDGGADPQELAATTGLTVGAARQAVHRIRERFRVAVREEIAQTLDAPDEAAVEAEFEAFARILTGNGGAG